MTTASGQPSEAAVKDARSAIRNSAASIMGQLANLAVGLISSIYIARTLGKDQFGMFNWAAGLCTIVMAVANAGIDQVIIREVAKQRQKASEYLCSAFLCKIFFSGLCYLGIIWYLNLRDYSGMQLAVGYIICSTVIAESFNYSCRAVFTGMERQDTSAAISVATNLLRVITVVTLVKLGYDVVALAYVTVVVTVLTLALHLIALKKMANLRWALQFGVSKHLVVVGSTFLASQFFAGIFDRADYIMLDIYKDVGTVGIYGAAYRVIDIVVMIGYSCSVALFPIISKKTEGSHKGYARAVYKATKYLTLFGIPLCVGIYLLSHQLMVGLYSSQYAASGTCLAILIWSRIAMFAILPGQQSVAARNAQLWLVPPVIARAIINIGLNLFLIPRYGYIGASISMVITENVYYILNYIIAFRGPERFNPLTLFWKPVVCTVAMAAVIVLLRPFGIIPAVIAAVPSYAIAITLIGALDSEDKALLRALVGSIRTNRVSAA